MPEATIAKSLRDVAPEPGVPKPDAILTVEGARKSFGGLVAVDVGHLEVQRGVITALIGPNGAGKTTFFNLLTGFDHADRGSWDFDGVHIRPGTPPHMMARRGMVRTFQLTKALGKLTVLENMKLAATEQLGERFWTALVPPSWRKQERENEERALELLDQVDMLHMKDEYAATLSGGQRKLLEMARALMVNPTMIMLDEPVAGVNPALTQRILEHVLDLPRRGMTVVFVEHDMDVVMGISDWVVCMAEGQIIAEGPPQAVGQNEAVIDAYLGTHRGAPVETEEATADTSVSDGRPSSVDAGQAADDPNGAGEDPDRGGEPR